MQLIDADKAQPGTTVTALVQTAGRGQRGNSWAGRRGESILMSLITVPQQRLDAQFLFSASVAVAVANVLQNSYQPWQVHIKWPNDLIINAKKAGGILIENVLRGSNWLYSVVGLGLNVLQPGFAADLPQATSLQMESGIAFSMEALIAELREHIILHTALPQPADRILAAYNALLFRRGEEQVFLRDGREEVFRIVSVLPDGRLEAIGPDGRTAHFRHGEVVWSWA